MGKRTFESLIYQNGRPLPGRRNLVLSHESEWTEWENVEVFSSIPEALEAVRDVEQLYITGGANVYEAFLKTADRLELTLVEGDHEGDVFFPPYEHLIGTEFEETWRENHEGFAFVTFERIPDPKTA
jgi:dihydrofolate reductase